MEENSGTSSWTGDPNPLTNDSSVAYVSRRGNLAKSLKEAIDLTIRKYLQQIKFSMFQIHFSEVYENDPENLKHIYSQFVVQLKENIQLEVQKICSDEDIENRLDALDDIISESTQHVGQNAWRPSTHPYQDLQDHLFAIKVKHKEKLEKMLRKLDSQNASLLDIYRQNHDGILENKELNKGNLSDFAVLPQLIQNSSELLEQKFLAVPNPEVAASGDDEL